MFRRVLVANRGEIAVRVIRAIHDLGAEAVAVFSDADRDALHVRLAEYAVPVGPAPAAQSYLRIEAILDAARQTGAEAIHPGYGFLSENAAFARACREAGIVFIGPSPDAMTLMGDKVSARRIAAQAGVPTVPGTPDPVRDDATALAAAADIGFPVLIKAAAGGGGKGMRAVQSAADLPAALAQARSEATASFGDGSVYLERQVQRPRHIEVQLFGDGQGRVVHLGERECSLQRRFQKVVEESPAPGLPDDVRHRLWQAAVDAATAARYGGAGTIEFLYEPSSGEFFFLEMNARLQVEHPVTELVAGVDLVHAQLKLAAGASIEDALGRGPFEGATGHAIEVRVGAEDPSAGWIPATGRIDLLREPAGPGVRVDSACEPGMEVGVYYDPLLAKLIAYGRSRQEAIARLRRALDEYVLTGVKTSLPFHRWVVRDEAFLKGDLSTAFISERWKGRSGSSASDEVAAAAQAALANHVEGIRRARQLGATGMGAGEAGRANGAPPASSRGGRSAWREVGRREGLR